MFRRAFVRFVPAGIAATASHLSLSNGKKDLIFIKPTFCSDNDDEFLLRHKLVEQLSKEGNSHMIPQDLFDQNDGKFSTIPGSLVEKYRELKTFPVETKTPRNKVQQAVVPINIGIQKIAALHNNGMMTKAQHELDHLVRKDNLKSIKNLPEDVFNMIPPTVSSVRIQYEEQGSRISSAQFSKIRTKESESPHELKHSSHHPKSKQKKLENNSKVMFHLANSSSDESEHLSGMDIATTVSSISADTGERSTVKRKSKSETTSLRDNKNHKCDVEKCKCSKRIFQQGCCDVCRIHFECSCGDCIFASGRESGSLASAQRTNKTRQLLSLAAAEYTEISQDVGKRQGYIFERRRDTIIGDSNGRETHNWRVGTISSGFVECCDKGFYRFYRTSSKNLNTMKNKTVEMRNGDLLVSSIRSNSLDEVPNRMSGTEMQQLYKRSSTLHGIVLDEDEKASLRWAPSKTRSPEDECYGWLYEMFGDVAEDMPNRYD